MLLLGFLTEGIVVVALRNTKFNGKPTTTKEGEKDVKLKNKDLVSCILVHKSVAPIFVGRFQDFVHNSCCAGNSKPAHVVIQKDSLYNMFTGLLSN